MHVRLIKNTCATTDVLSGTGASTGVQSWTVFPSVICAGIHILWPCVCYILIREGPLPGFWGVGTGSELFAELNPSIMCRPMSHLSQIIIAKTEHAWTTGRPQAQAL